MEQWWLGEEWTESQDCIRPKWETLISSGSTAPLGITVLPMSRHGFLPCARGIRVCGFLKSCSKTYLDEIRVDDLENFQVRLRSQGQSDRTAANRVGQVVTFLRKHGIQNVSIRPGYLRKKVLPYSEGDLRACSKPHGGRKTLVFLFSGDGRTGTV